MKRLVLLVIAFAIVGVLVSVKLRKAARPPAAPEGEWELADDPAPS